MNSLAVKGFLLAVILAIEGVLIVAGLKIIPYQNHTRVVIPQSSLASTTQPIIASTTQKTKAVVPAPKIQSSTSEIPEKVSQTNLSADFSFLAASEHIGEKTIDVRTIVFIKCLYRTQFYKISKQPWNEEEFIVGSGVIISPEGYVLTAAHLLVPPEPTTPDANARVWGREKCDVLETDAAQTPVPEAKYWEDPEFQSRFQEVSIAFEPAQAEYQSGNGLDFAILKIQGVRPFPYVSLFPQLIQFKEKDPLLAIGYPGRETTTQKLERFDGEFKVLTYLSGNPLCDGTLKPCGLRYIFRRYSYDHEKEFWQVTDLGIISPFFRAGFSGAPVFYKGNVIGIVTHKMPNETAQGWEGAYALTSYDILQTLRTHSIAIQ